MLPYAHYVKDYNVVYAMGKQVAPAPLDIDSTIVKVRHPGRRNAPTRFSDCFARYPGLWELCQECWSFAPGSRPSCENILANLSSLRSVDQI